MAVGTHRSHHALHAFRPARPLRFDAFPIPHSAFRGASGKLPSLPHYFLYHRLYFNSFDTTSSTVIVPIGRPSSSTIVSIRRLYLSKISNTSLSLASGGSGKRGSLFNLESVC